MPSADFGREILKSTVFKFSPETQKLRSNALDQILANAIYRLGGEADEGELIELLVGETSITPSATDIQRSLARLVDSEKVLATPEHGDNIYQLTDAQEEEIRTKSSGLDSLKHTTVEKLTAHKDIEADHYTEPFFDVLAYIFAELGEESVSVLDGPHEDSGLSSASVFSYCERIATEDETESRVLKQMVMDFFDQADPHYNRLKWQYAQSFFIARSIGLDAGGSTLGGEIFHGALFIVDTNVLIPAIEPADRLHSSFRLIHRMAETQMEAQFEVCTSTLEELDDWATDQFGKVNGAFDMVPRKFFERASSIFARIHKRKKREGTLNGAKSLFERFNNAKDILEKEGRIEVNRNSWFVDNHKNDRKTQQLVQHVRNASQRVRDQDKAPNFQALHDALLLRWAIYQRKQGYKAWILTADTSLPSTKVPFNEGRPLVVTMDALLQWLSPTVDSGQNLEDFQQVFSELLRTRLLPQEAVFSLSDLNVFAQLGVSVRDLPDRDVEKCIEVIRSKSDELNLGLADDREELIYELRKVLSSPNREYKRRLKRKERELAEKDEQIGELESKAEEVGEELDDVRGDNESLRGRLKRYDLATQGKRRLGSLFLLLVAESAFVWYLGIETYYWVLLILVPSTLGVFGNLLIDKQHLSALGILPSDE